MTVLVIDIHDGGHGFLRGGAQAHGTCLSTPGLRRIFIQCDHAAARCSRQQLRLEGVDNEQQRQCDGDGLGE